MRYIVEFINKDETMKCSYKLANITEAISLGKTLAQNQTFTIWKEYEVTEHYLSWNVLETVQEKCYEYENGKRI